MIINSLNYVLYIYLHNLINKIQSKLCDHHHPKGPFLDKLVISRYWNGMLQVSVVLQVVKILSALNRSPKFDFNFCFTEFRTSSEVFSFLVYLGTITS